MKDVVYLFGAGASHACVKAVGSGYGILMGDLGEDLAKHVRKIVDDKYAEERSLEVLVNEVVDDETDYEHVITFLDQSVSTVHRAFADDLRDIFEQVLREKLRAIEDEQGTPPVGLYEALLDMYEVPGVTERLAGVLTINYDEYIERAIEGFLRRPVDFGIDARGVDEQESPIKLIKLHGSFGWQDAWPIVRDSDASPPLWIPPGIQKAKDRYPFNALWGLARELLDCDVLRIVGCKLGPNDWDLISLLFSTRNLSAQGRRYDVEVIDAPIHAYELSQAFPFLNVRSILEIEPLGSQLIAEFTGGAPTTFDSLSQKEQDSVRELAGRKKNWFWLWLKQMAEGMYTRLGSLQTSLGKFETLLES